MSKSCVLNWNRHNIYMSEVFQSTNTIMMMEPARFHSNPQTMETNTYQAPDPEDITPVHHHAVEEYRRLRDRLVEEGVIVVSTIGQPESPDDIFCNNWVATFAEADGSRSMTLFPMLAENRRIERRADLLNFLGRLYDLKLDLSEEEQHGRFLESTGSLWCDRVNKVAYIALSDRTNEALAQRFCETYGFRTVMFHTRNHADKPVYHTDVMMYIGSGYAGLCLDCILPADRARVRDQLSKTHEIIEITMEQLRAFCGNSLELRDRHGQTLLAMSSAAHAAYTTEQKDTLLRYVDRIIHTDITTIEKYGGGSVRCMLLELH